MKSDTVFDLYVSHSISTIENSKQQMASRVDYWNSITKDQSLQVIYRDILVGFILQA
jgi:hypothetical protein